MKAIDKKQKVYDIDAREYLSPNYLYEEDAEITINLPHARVTYRNVYNQWVLMEIAVKKLAVGVSSYTDR